MAKGWLFLGRNKQSKTEAVNVDNGALEVKTVGNIVSQEITINARAGISDVFVFHSSGATRAGVGPYIPFSIKDTARLFITLTNQTGAQLNEATTGLGFIATYLRPNTNALSGDPTSTGAWFANGSEGVNLANLASWTFCLTDVDTVAVGGSPVLQPKRGTEGAHFVVRTSGSNTGGIIRFRISGVGK